MVYLTNTAHSFGDHPAVQEFFNALRLAFKLPSRYQLANTLLQTIYEEVAEAVHKELAKADYIAGTSDGLSRSQGDIHVTNYQACTYGASYFLDMDASSTERVTSKLPALFIAVYSFAYHLCPVSKTCSALIQVSTLSRRH